MVILTLPGLPEITAVDQTVKTPMGSMNKVSFGDGRFVEFYMTANQLATPYIRYGIPLPDSILAQCIRRAFTKKYGVHS